MQTRKETEYTLMVLFRDSDAIVVDFDHPVRPGPFGGNANFRWLLAAILQCVTDQVLKKPDQIAFVRFDGWQRLDRNLRPTGSDGCLQILHGLLRRHFHFHVIQRPLKPVTGR